MKKWKVPAGISFNPAGSRKRGILALLLAAVPLTVFAAGCSKKDFDASACASACLDSILKGDDTAARQLAEDQADDQAELLASVRSQLLSERVSLSLGDNGDGPGGVQLSPELEQNYTTLWEDIFAKTDYSVSSAEKADDDSYQVTLSTAGAVRNASGTSPGKASGVFRSIRNSGGDG